MAVFRENGWSVLKFLIRIAESNAFQIRLTELSETSDGVATKLVLGAIKKERDEALLTDRFRSRIFTIGRITCI